MQAILQKLDNSLSLTLQRLGLAATDAPAPARLFTAIAQAADSASQRFDFGAPPVPPLAQRQAAIGKLLAQDQLTMRDWRLVCYGLTDNAGRGECLLEMPQAFDRLHTHLSAEIKSGYLRRKSWFGLVSSYFAFEGQNREQNGQWRKLRQLIVSGFKRLQAAQTTPKKWISTVRKHEAIFGDNPAVHLAKMLVDDEGAELQQLKTTLQIPEHSWLWEQLMVDLATIMNGLSETQFLQKMDALLDLMNVYPRYGDFIFASILKRYAKGDCREVTHARLKDIGLDRWGSPQISSRKNLWSHHAGDDVVKMILRWFAKDDLEHFFKLLQGESQVDQRRLNYWLRFVGQMAFTRIALGDNSYFDKRTEFVEFREKNKGRFAQLKGGKHIDAFMMQIDEYLFVEFSGTGNALYIYEKDRIPFALDAGVVQLNNHLKIPSHLKKLGSHSNKLTHSGEWEVKSDALLAKLGILPDVNSITSKSANKYLQAHNNSAAQMQVTESIRARSVYSTSNESELEAIIHFARSELIRRGLSLREEDNRSNGGAYWFVTSTRLPAIEKQLFSWGFKYAGRGYWIK